MQKKSKLTLLERELIYGLINQGKSYRSIALELGRNHSSIVREILRNKNQNSGEYLPCIAQIKADKRESLQRRSAPLKEPEIFLYVRRKLRIGWSPETITGRLSIDHPDKYICPETIYQYIYAKAKHPHEDLFNQLTLHRKRRMKKHGRKVKRTLIPDRIGIEERSPAILLRKEYGHGETDLMEGIRSDKKVVSVTVERKTRYAKFSLLEKKTARAKAKAVRKDLEYLSLKTMTTDNGVENISHKNWKLKTYFTTPYHSWEKGTVENTIGRLRRYLPKHTSLTTLTKEDLRYIEWEMNSTPRKCLHFLTPREALTRELKNTII